MAWLHNPDAKIIKAVVAELCQRRKHTKVILWKTNTDAENTKKADELAHRALQKTTTDNVDVSIERHIDLQGMKLSQGSQALFYKGILKSKASKNVHWYTTINLAITRYEVNEISGKTPIDSQIWKSIRDRDIPKSIQSFLWKSIHNAYKIGNFWTKIPEYEHRANCCLCGEVENMDHILVECQKSHPIKI